MKDGNMSAKPYNLIGIGAGPSHLSMAALLEKIPDVRCLFFEGQSNFNWHEGMMIRGAKLQVSFLKDLVTLVDPTSHYTFINYLHHQQRLYQYITADFKQTYRQEFNHYLQWVSEKLKTVRKNTKICEVQFKNAEFELITDTGEKLAAKNISIGIGQTSYTPDVAKKVLGVDVFHSSQYMHMQRNYMNKDVLVLGSGQSGAEIFYSLIENDVSAPNKVYWVSRSPMFRPIDDSAFANELFTPAYSQFFYELPLEKRFSLLVEQHYTSDGISRHSAQNIFQRLYELRYLSKQTIKIKLKLNCVITAIEKKRNRYAVILHDQVSERSEQFMVDKIILATGYSFSEPACIEPISHLLQRKNQHLMIDRDYSIHWQGEDSNKIFIVNGAKITHGIADPNLSLLAYRSARIINSLIGFDFYKNIQGRAMVDWHNIEEHCFELLN
jgi:lysine N6-hydroxylase